MPSSSRHISLTHMKQNLYSLSLLSTGRKQLASRFNFTYSYIDDVLSINNPEFENYLGQMYPVELEIKDTTESDTYMHNFDALKHYESTEVNRRTWLHVVVHRQ